MSVTKHSLVIISPAIEAAFCRALSRTGREVDGRARMAFGVQHSQLTSCFQTNIIGRVTKMTGDSALHELLASKTLIPLLKALLLNPDKPFYQRELADIAQARLYSVQTELARLERTGLITSLRRGNRVYYQTNRHHPLFDDLKRIVLKTVGIGDAIRAALAERTGRVRLAAIFGSYAAGEERSSSDIDLLLVGNLTLKESAAMLGPVGRDLGREINPVIYPPAEFQRKVKEGNHFLKEVLDGPMIFLIGDEHELAALRG